MQILHTNAPDFEGRWKRLCARGSDEDEAGGPRGGRRQSWPTSGPAATRPCSTTPRRLDGWVPALRRRPGGWARADFAAAWRSLPAAGRKALRLAADRIEAFHRRERDAEVPALPTRSGRGSARCRARSARVGLYVPGRHRPLPLLASS